MQEIRLELQDKPTKEVIKRSLQTYETQEQHESNSDVSTETNVQRSIHQIRQESKHKQTSKRIGLRD